MTKSEVEDAINKVVVELNSIRGRICNLINTDLEDVITEIGELHSDLDNAIDDLETASSALEDVEPDSYKRRK
jgi:hypothetical protein